MSHRFDQASKDIASLIVGDQERVAAEVSAGMRSSAQLYQLKELVKQWAVVAQRFVDAHEAAGASPHDLTIAELTAVVAQMKQVRR